MKLDLTAALPTQKKKGPATSFILENTCASYIEIEVSFIYKHNLSVPGKEKHSYLKDAALGGRSSHSVPARACALHRHCGTLLACHEPEEGWTMPQRLLKACMS